MLSWLAERGCAAAAEAALARGADPNSRCAHGKMPLMRAAPRGRNAVAVVLLGHGARLDTVDARGDTALRIAGLRGDESFADLLRVAAFLSARASARRPSSNLRASGSDSVEGS